MKVEFSAAAAAGLVVSLVVSLALSACSAPPQRGGGAAATQSEGPGKSITQTIACLGGGAGGVFLAKALATAEAKRLKLNAVEARKRERGYVIGFALLGCGGAASLAGTAYAKMSEQGRQARERELQEAAASAKPRTYRDPANPQLVGTATPQPAYQDPEKNRECRDVVDHLAEAGQGEPIVVKYCRNLSGGPWAPVTA